MLWHMYLSGQDNRAKPYHIRTEQQLDDLLSKSTPIDLIIECRFLSLSAQKKITLLKNVYSLTLRIDDLPTLEFFSELQNMPLLHSLIIENAENLDEGILKNITKVDHLIELRLLRCDLTDEDMGILASMRQLRTFAILSSAVTDLGLEHLTSLKYLEILELYNCNITNQGVSKLTAFHNLKELVLSHSFGLPEVDDTVFQHIASLKQLKKLHLDECSNITEKGLTYLSSLDQLEELQLGWLYSKICPLNKLINLKKLTLESAPPHSIQSLSQLSHLKFLRLGSAIVDEDIVHLLSLRQLEALDLSYCKISDQAISNLVSLKQLRYLDISFTNVTDIGCGYLMQLRNLQTLNLEGCDQITSKGLCYLSNLSELRNLNLSNCSLIQDEGLFYLANCKHLEELNLYKCSNITDHGLSFLSKLMCLYHIKAINCKNLTELSQKMLPNVHLEITYWRDKRNLQSENP